MSQVGVEARLTWKRVCGAGLPGCTMSQVGQIASVARLPGWGGRLGREEGTRGAVGGEEQVQDGDCARPPEPSCVIETVPKLIEKTVPQFIFRQGEVAAMPAIESNDKAAEEFVKQLNPFVTGITTPYTPEELDDM